MTGIIILAAGSSSRLGQPKQNLVYNGKTLLQNSIEAALASGCHPVVLILGEPRADISASILPYQIHVAHNNNWHEGIASSIRCGIQQLLKLTPALDDCIVMLCDQPHVSGVILSSLISIKKATGKKIAACLYSNHVGVPAIFDQHYFAHLLALQGNEGAKKLINQYKHDVATLDFAEGNIDIDTVKDYEELIQSHYKVLNPDQSN